MTNPPDSQPEREEKPAEGEGKRPRGMGGVFIITLLLLALFFVLGRSRDQGRATVYDFWSYLYQGKLQTVSINPESTIVSKIRASARSENGPRQIETTFRELTPEEERTIRRIQAYQVSKIYESGGMHAFLADLEAGDITVDQAWLVHETRSALPPEARPAERPRGGPDPENERIYLCAIVTKGNEELYTIAPLTPGRANKSTTLQQVAAALRSRDVPFEHVPLSPDPSFEVQKVDTLTYYLIGTIAPWILIIGLFWFFIIRQMRSPGGGGGVLSFGRSRVSRYNREKNTQVTFDDVEGMDEAKEEVREVIEFLKNRGKFQRLGGKIPRGVLLVGPPGTGKTLLAKAIAGEAGVPFFSISGSDFVEMFVGVGASRVRDLFKQARESSPCIVFLDEIDAVGRKRGSGMGGGHDEREQTLNAILVELDGFTTDEGIILIGATNRPDVLDPALLRPGRFDRQVVIDMPDIKGREAILAVHAREVRISDKVDFMRLARATPGFSGAELAALINEAAILAGMRGDDRVEMTHLEEARDRVRWGREKKSRRMLEEDRRVTAYHEAGHALVGARIPEVDPVHKVTIISRGAALGATMYLPERDDYHMRRSKLLGMIAMSYGGRVAEELVFNDTSTGAQNDIKQATLIARTMVAEWGMSERVGPLNFAGSPENQFLGHDFHFGHEHSEETARLIDKEVKTLVAGCYERASEILSADREILDAIAEALMRYETLSGEEIRAIVEGTSIDDLRPEVPEPSEPEEDVATPTERKPDTAATGDEEDLGLSGAEGLATS